MKTQLLKKYYFVIVYILFFIVFMFSMCTYQSVSYTSNGVNILNPNSYLTEAMFLDSNLCLVNTNHYLEKTYVPKNLICINKFNIDFIDRNQNLYLNKEAFVNLCNMINDMEKLSLNICIFSTYRSYDKQAFLKSYDNNFEVASPGHSEHQLGLAVDVSRRDVGLTFDFSYTNEYKWLYENCYKYGFILRYLKNYSATTGITFEPWHLRYVSLEHSMIIKNEMSLEEYINKYYKS